MLVCFISSQKWLVSSWKQESNRSGCFKELIYKIRDMPWQDEVIWMPRERISETFHSQFQDGNIPYRQKDGEEEMRTSNMKPTRK